MAQAQLKIFFDLDGTLIDVSVRHHKVYSELVMSYGGTSLPQSTYWDLKRNKITWPEILEKSGLSSTLVPAFLNSFINIIESPDYLKLDVLFSDTIPTLQTLALQNDCFLVSLRRNHENFVAEISWLGLDKFFNKVLTGHSENDGYDKKIELISEVLEKGEEALIVGDTEADIITGKNLGLKTVAVLSGIRDREILESLEPDFIINDIRDLIKIVTDTTPDSEKY
jgi:phosphoglycolate phosphatase